MKKIIAKKRNMKKVLAIGVLGIVLLSMPWWSMFLYFPGANFLGNYCSINTTLSCYWYNEELCEFQPVPSEVSVKCAGFTVSENIVDKETMKGKIQVSGMEMDYENHNVNLRFSTFGSIMPYYEISCSEHIVVLQENGDGIDSKPGIKHQYRIKFLKENPELICVEAKSEGSDVWTVGYCGASVEEAEKVRAAYRK